MRSSAGAGARRPSTQTGGGHRQRNAEDACGISRPGGVKGEFRKNLDRLGAVLFNIFSRDTEPEFISKLHSLDDASSLTACLNAYESLWDDDIVLALCVDEMQRCPATETALGNLGALHDLEHYCRIAPLFFGLSHTADWVRGDVGLTRLNGTFEKTIGALQEGEARQVIEGTFDHLGVDWWNAGWRSCAENAGFDEQTWNGFRSDLADVIEEDSNDFPQHITVGIIAACSALIRRRQDFRPAEADAILAEVQDEHQAKKAHYYDKRLVSAGLERYSMAMGTICRMAEQSGDGCVNEDMAVQAISTGTSRDITDEDADKVLQEAVKTGLLTHIKADEQYAPPSIPSMQTHLIKRLAQRFERRHSTAVRLNDQFDLQLNAGLNVEP